MNKEEQIYRLNQKLDALYLSLTLANDILEVDAINDKIDFIEYELYELEHGKQN